ncbi:TolB family protein, partial [Streptacidiphilus monticola]
TLTALGTTLVLHASSRADARNRPRAGGPVVTAGTVTLTQPGRILVRNMAWGPHRDELAAVSAADPAGPRTASGVKCLRFYAAGGTGICLQSVPDALRESYRALVLDARLHTLRAFPLAGIPTRSRVSPDGRFVAWTVFVGGDSYSTTNFSTRTSIVDTRTWQLTSTLEDFAIVMDGRQYRSVDDNFWGVTFAADDDTFYATLGTRHRTYLVKGSISRRTVSTVLTNVECPSLSPDGTRIAFKKRVPGLPDAAPWREYVLDLRTLRETPVADSHSIDDQAVWLDDRTLAYALPGDFGTDLWTAPADGSGRARKLIADALAPAPVRG